jgi:hypothetical protein
LWTIHSSWKWIQPLDCLNFLLRQLFFWHVLRLDHQFILLILQQHQIELKPWTNIKQILHFCNSWLSKCFILDSKFSLLENHYRCNCEFRWRCCWFHQCRVRIFFYTKVQFFQFPFQVLYQEVFFVWGKSWWQWLEPFQLVLEDSWFYFRLVLRFKAK